MNPEHIFRSIVSDLQKSPDTLVIFDIDSTLLCTSDRTQEILRDSIHNPDLAREYPEEAQALQSITVTPQDWGIRSALERFQLRSTASFFEAIRAHWVQNFFSNRYLHLDPPYPGAVEFVSDLYRSGAWIKYLTARDEVRMGEGTRARMQSLGFPGEEDNAELQMKPTPEWNDREFKVHAVEKLAPKWSKIWYFENEPTIIEALDKSYDHLNIVFMDTVHSQRAEAPTHLQSLGMSFLRNG